MDKSTLGLLLIPIVIANIYWSARIYTLMRFNGNPDEVEKSRKKAAAFSRFSKVSYFAVLLLVGAFWFFSGR